jgi:sarcosine oxidase subunit beta
VARTADVVVIGAGVAGCAVAGHLLRLSPGLSVLLVDAHHVGAGSTSRSTAAFRHQWSLPAHVAFSRYGALELDRLGALGYGVDFRRNGYLFLYTSAGALAHAAARAERQRALGVEVHVLSGDEVSRLPCGSAILTEDLAGATWGPRDGFLDPLGVAQAYLQEARAGGLDYLPGRALTGFETRGEGITAVRLTEGTVSTARVVVAAGVWTPSVLALLGLDFPLRPAKRYLYHSRPMRERDVSAWPLVIGDRGAHVRPSGGNTLMMAWERLPEPLPECPPEPGLWSLQDTTEPGFGPGEYGLAVLAELSRQVPCLALEVSLAQVTSGWYPETIDNKAVLGADPRCPGLFLAAGHGGHGIMHGPATGLTVAEVVLGRETTLLPRAEVERHFGVGPLLTGATREPREEMGL